MRLVTGDAHRVGCNVKGAACPKRVPLAVCGGSKKLRDSTDVCCTNETGRALLVLGDVVADAAACSSLDYCSG